MRFSTQSILRTRETLFLWISTVALALITLKAGHDLWLRILYELRGPYTADSPIYWAVGHGILNGLIPYRDLFETKPPGIFLVSAVSLWLTGDTSLGYILQALVLLMIPLTIICFAWRQSRDYAPLLRAFLTLASMLFGMLLAMYTAERSGEFQAESFGAVFGVLYVLLIAGADEVWTRWRTLLCALAILLAVGIKEPFLLSTFAASLFLVRTRATFIRTFLMPLSLAAALGMGAMAFLGYLGPYLTLYLPEMLGGHIQGAGPFALRGLPWERLIADLHAYTPLLGGSIGLLALSALVLRLRATRGLLRRCGVVILFALGVYLTTLSVGIGGPFYNHHFAFAVPAYVALFALVLRELYGTWNHALLKTLLACLLLTASSAALAQTHRNYEASLATLHIEAEPAVQAAAQIDRILDACVVSQYLFIGSNGPHLYGYTKHSPLGPLFFQYGYYFDGSRPEFRAQFLASVARAQVAVIDHYDLQDLTGTVRDYLAANFTETPWPCAATFEPLSKYTVLFRSSPEHFASLELL